MASRRRRATGQHFLTDARYISRIVEAAALGPGDHVLEVGPGLGALTGPLIESGSRVTAVEKDHRLVAELERRYAGDDRLRIRASDATRADLSSLGPFTKIVSNLPYSVSTPLTFRFLALRFESAVLMYQREFADRLAATPGTSDYGRLTAAVAYHARVERLFDVPPGAFTPPPRVGSTVVRLTPHAQPPFVVPDVDYYRDVLRITFSNRRKTLRSTLRSKASAFGIDDPADAVSIVDALGWGDRRPETLSPSEFGRLARALKGASDG